MEDKKKKKEDKKKRDSSQKVPDPKIKVPEAAKPPTIQPPSAPGPISPGPPPTTSSSGGPGASLPPPDGGNNVKQRAAVATGQPSSSSSNSSCSSSSSSSGSQASSTAQRYIPREVPPRFRCQQDHKVLLKRGQPPLSSMLLGGGAGGGGAGGGATPPPLSSQSGETPPAGPIDLNPGSSYSSSPSVAAAASSTTSSYANSTWGAGSGSQPPSQGWEKVIVDGSDLEAWPSILGGAKPCSGGTGGGASREQDHAPNSSASWNERNVQQKGVGEVGGGDHPSSPPSPPPPSSSSLAECAGGSPWGSSPSESGTGSDALNNSNMSHLGPGSQKSPGGSCSSSSGGGGGGPAPGPGFNPSTNPSAWPALGPEQTQGPGDGLRPSTSPLPPSSGSQPGLQQQQAEGPGAGVSGGGEPWGGPGAEQGPQRGAGTGATGLGPNQGSGGDGGANRSGSSSSSSSSSWRAMPPTSSSEITAGVSPGDGWGSGGQIQEDKAWGSQGDTTGWGQPDSHGETTGWGQPASQGDTTGWGQPSDSSSTTPGASQGAGEGGGTGESGWGGSGNTAIGTGGTAQPGGRGGSNSSSSGGSGGVGGGALQDSASTAFASGAKAWDNQTAEEKSGERGRVEWGGAGEGGRQTGVGGGVAGAGSSAGGGAPNQKTDSSGGPSSQPTPNAEVALKSMLSRSDLDPRVLSNVGWGQTQIRQNVAWDMEASAAAAAAAAGGGKLKDKSSSSSSSSSTNTTRGSGYSGANVGSKTTEPPTGGGSGSSSGPGPKRDSWDGAVAHQPGRGPHMEAGNRRKAGSPVGNSEGNPAKTAGGWGGLAPESQGKPWGGEEPQEWRDHRGGGGGGGGWRDGGEQGRGGWGAPPENKGTGGWKDVGGGGPSGGGGGGRDWGQRESKPGGMWGEGRGGGRMNSDEGSSWGDEGGPQRGGWGGGDAGGGGGGGSKPHQEWGGGKPHGPPAQTPNSQVAPMKAPNQQQQQQHQSQGQQPAMAGGWGGRPSTGPPPPSKSQNQSPGWTSGPVPRAAGPGGGVGGVDPAESSGWEEPSPQSISRKMEIDDGTSAWGDPQRYSHKNVNMWDKNSGSGGQGSGGPGSGGPGHGQQGPSPPNPQQPPRRQPPNRESGNSAVGMWGKGGGQPDDTSAGGWGQSSSSSPSAAPAGWGDPDPDPGKPSGWGNPSANPGKPGPKSGEGWGSKGEGPVAASRHSSWDEEEEGSVWNSGGSQGGWGHGHGGARGHVKGGRGESWGNPMSRQFANMGLLGDDPGGDKKMEGDKRGMSDYNGEMRRGRGGGGYRMPGSKDIVAGDMGHYGDKMSGHGVYGGGGGGGGMPPSRGMHQPGGHPMTPTQGLRAQVPHQYMSAQVPGSMMKQMPSPGNSIGGGGGVGGVGGGGGAGAGGVFPPQLSPQQLAMLSNIYPHVQQFHLACQLLLQQQQQQHQQQQQLLQNQRKFPQPLRQQTDPQQLARIMAVLQQQRQQQGGGGGGSSKLSPSHLGGGGLPKQPMTGDPLSHPGGGGVSLSDFHAKTQAMYSGLAPGGNLSGLDLGQGGGPGMKDPGGGQQSRFKWMMEGHSPSSSSPDAIAAMHKNGPIPNPMKNRGGSPYSQYEMLGPEGLGLPPQGPMDHWHRSPGTKMPHKPGPPSWPPEFQPGVPWKGIPSAGDPESDPFMTPGSVMNPPGPQSLQDSDHPLLRDNTGPNCSLPTSLPSSGAWPYSASDGPLANAHSSAKYSEYKPSWPPEPIGHNKLWKTNRISSQLPRPPPGLSSQKQAQPSPWGSGGPRLARGWGGGGGGGGASQDSRFSQGSAWSDGLASRGSCWLLLSNLTPQIDGSTLRTICMQHGPLLTFHLGLTQGSALIRYSSPQEAAKAQGALHMCVLGNTTILAEFVSEEEVARYFAHSQAGGGDGGPTGSAPGGPQGSSGPGPSVASSGGSSPGSERGPATPGGGGGGGGGAGGVGGSTVLSTGSGWQNLDGSGSSSEGSGAPGPGLGVFSQWSTNGTGDGAGPGGAEPGGRPGMWGAVTVGYPGGGGSMWGTPQIEERHQMDNPAALLPGDLLGGGADSI